jgi:hypothetical protein
MAPCASMAPAEGAARRSGLVTATRTTLYVHHCHAHEACLACFAELEGGFLT